MFCRVNSVFCLFFAWPDQSLLNRELSEYFNSLLTICTSNKSVGSSVIRDRRLYAIFCRLWNTQLMAFC